MQPSRTLAFTLAALLAASPFAAAEAAMALPADLYFSTAYAEDEDEDEEDDLYTEAQDALDERRWGRAVELFGRVARLGGDQADDALYWKAYSQHRAGHKAEALASLRQLQSSFPKSNWVDDAKALEVEIRAGGGKANPDQLADEELKLYAINSLMGAEPERAVPLLQKFLRGNHSLRLKEKALFVLSQADSPEGRKTLLEIARGSAQPELQRKAIEYLGVSGDGAALRELYRAAGPAVKGKLLEAMLVAGDTEGLSAAAREERDPKLRRKAIHTLGVTGGKGSGEVLRAIYASTSDRETRLAVLEALFVQNNARALIEIFRSEKDPDLKREAVQKLTLIDDPEADRFLESILDD
ncbi:MAG TPA: tetratricopeptide repeat protein [Thermoanaerobaculia bacterium]|nr:tetratricopeptide repeat protein [Thermoanaerobaculia bacterium]